MNETLLFSFSLFNQLLGGHVPQKLPVIQHKAEATSENNASSNRSSDTKQKSKESSEKGSIAQVRLFSGCTVNMSHMLLLKSS